MELELSKLYRLKRQCYLCINIPSFVKGFRGNVDGSIKLFTQNNLPPLFSVTTKKIEDERKLTLKSQILKFQRQIKATVLFVLLHNYRLYSMYGKTNILLQFFSIKSLTILRTVAFVLSKRHIPFCSKLFHVLTDLCSLKSVL